MDDIFDQLIDKVMVFNETIWDYRTARRNIDRWLSNFEQGDGDYSREQLHALYLLSQFIYFGARQVRELIKALFRDLYKYPIVESIRKQHNNTTDNDLIQSKFIEELKKTRFLGIGNPSESGYHLLYYFRQENMLPKELFIHGHEIFRRDSGQIITMLRYPEVTRYVFIDDLCGSGTQAKQYSHDLLETMKQINPQVKVSYYVLIASNTALTAIRHPQTLFDEVECIYEIDKTFKCFEPGARCFIDRPNEIDINYTKDMCLKYGTRLWADHPLGYKDGQLLIGFHHNTPDNTLPIIWYDEPWVTSWEPIFKRYTKYGWYIS